MVVTFDSTSMSFRYPAKAHVVRKQIKVKPIWQLPPLRKIHLDVEEFETA